MKWQTCSQMNNPVEPFGCSRRRPLREDGIKDPDALLRRFDCFVVSPQPESGGAGISGRLEDQGYYFYASFMTHG